LNQAKFASPGRPALKDALVTELALARQAEARARDLARGIRTLIQWLSHDVLALAGPNLGTRRELFDFITDELERLEPEDVRRIHPVRVALRNQRDDLLAFAGVLDKKLTAIARTLEISQSYVREACMLHRLAKTSTTYWQEWSRLRAKIGDKFRALLKAVSRIMARTPRSSSLVENLNSRLRNYFTLRRHLGRPYLDLLRFFLNHRRYMRSQLAERIGKSPRELMTGERHPHWLTLLDLGPLQTQRA
jgi:CHAD domain-containing protein